VKGAHAVTDLSTRATDVERARGASHVMANGPEFTSVPSSAGRGASLSTSRRSWRPTTAYWRRDWPPASRARRARSRSASGVANWLALRQAQALPNAPDITTAKGLHRAIITRRSVSRGLLARRFHFIPPA